MAGHIVRFSEFEYYNINEDEDWVRLMGTTDKGSYFCEVPRGTAGDLREARSVFKERVIEALTEGSDPQEISLEDAVHL